VTDLPAGEITPKLAAYRRPHLARSIFELTITAGALALIWAAAWIVFHQGLWWLALALTVPASLFLVRLFMIQHDCGHGSFFEAKAANDWVGRIIGVFTLTPYEYWRRSHAAHHATSGNLDRRGGLGEILTMTVDEYLALPPLRRLGYRLYRHPAVLFGLGPFYNFFLLQRLPVGLMKDWRGWVSTQGTTLAIIGLFVAGSIAFGWAPAVLVFVPTMLLGGTIGVWLFFVQHQFEGVQWARQGAWRREPAALTGSSHLDLPQPLKWLTANIGIHHVHHLNSRIPSYRLPEVLRDLPELKSISRVGLFEALRCATLGLWDEQNQRLVSFRQVRRAARA
jgi:omega-6 fatty acid desaturase (delta-12 desaturase)